MDLSKLSKSELEALMSDVVDQTIDELIKSAPNHNMPGLDDDFAEASAVAEANGATAKAEDECEEEDKEKPFEGKETKEEEEAEEKEEKSNTASADLIKAQLKGMVDLSKAVASLNEKVDKLSKGKGRERLSVISEKEVDVIQKSHGGTHEDLDSLISQNPREFAKALYEMQADKKIDGRYLTAFELFGARKIPDNMKKSILQKADLLK